jgi:hypothetical protein
MVEGGARLRVNGFRGSDDFREGDVLAFGRERRSRVARGEVVQAEGALERSGL